MGALDTKGNEFAFVKELIEKEGLKTILVDFGVLGVPTFQPDIDRWAVAAAGGGDLNVLRSGDHKDEAMRVMAAGLEATVKELHRQGRLDGIFGMGGRVEPRSLHGRCERYPWAYPRSCSRPWAAAM